MAEGSAYSTGGPGERRGGRSILPGEAGRQAKRGSRSIVVVVTVKREHVFSAMVVSILPRVLAAFHDSRQPYEQLRTAVSSHHVCGCRLARVPLPSELCSRPFGARKQRPLFLPLAVMTSKLVFLCRSPALTDRGHKWS